MNVGVDFALFRHRLSGTIEYYNKYSVDLLAAIMVVLHKGLAIQR